NHHNSDNPAQQQQLLLPAAPVSAQSYTSKQAPTRYLPTNNPLLRPLYYSPAPCPEHQSQQNQRPLSPLPQSSLHQQTNPNPRCKPIPATWQYLYTLPLGCSRGFFGETSFTEAYYLVYDG
ncbi:hypothetical protein BZA77DRAFT_261977, partial [Pyronema omphalodes]